MTGQSTHRAGEANGARWPRCAASAAIFRAKKVLLVERGKGALKGLWSLPGGHIEPGERAAAAAAREVLEEAGIEAEVLGLLDIHEVVLRAAGDQVVAFLNVNSYLSFVTLMLVVFGAAFELPLLVVMANLAGVLPGSLLKKSQRIGVFLIFLFAAVATPSTDPFTMCAMALPMVVLFEGAVLFAVMHDKRKARRREAERATTHLDDDVASQVDAIPEPLEPGSVESWSDTT